MKRPLRLGLLGTGLAARKLYWPALRQLIGRVDLVAVANRTRAKAEAFARDTDTPYVAADARELFRLPQVDAVMISLPIEQQPRYVLQALKAGKHVISEKPVAGSVADAKALLKAAAPWQRRGLKWMVGENFAFMDHVLAAEQWLSAGRVGDLRLVEARQCNHLDASNPYFHTAWRRKPRFVGGFVLDAGVHISHLLRRYFGLPTELKSLQALFNPATPPLDTALAVLRLRGGALASWISCFNHAVAGPMLTVRGTKATLELHHEHAVLRPHSGRPTTVKAKGIGFESQFLHFADAVLKHRPLAYSPREAVADLALMQGIVQGKLIQP
jgi:predicted dehydrogenase